MNRKQYSNKVGDPSSKYGYGRCLDADINSKLKAKEEFTQDINCVLDKLYPYHDGGFLSDKWKKEILLEVYKE